MHLCLASSMVPWLKVSHGEGYNIPPQQNLFLKSSHMRKANSEKCPAISLTFSSQILLYSPHKLNNTFAHLKRQLFSAILLLVYQEWLI